MKRLTLGGVFLLATLFLLVGCESLRTVRGTGDMAAENREVGSFSAIDLAGIGTVVIDFGDREALRIEAEENLLPYLETNVKDGTLVLGVRDGVNIVPTQSIFYYLTVRDLDAIGVSGLGNVDTPRLDAANMTLGISGGGSINIEELQADNLTVGISGLGELAIDGGEVGSQQIDINGGGTYKAKALASDEAKISIGGLGTAELWAREKLDAAISGGGTVHYAGRPQVTQQISGLGEVQPLDGE